MSNITAMLSRLQTSKKQAKDKLTPGDIKFLSEKITAYENRPRSCGERSLTCGSNTLQFLLLAFLLLFSGIPSKLGLFRFIAAQQPQLTGTTPAFTVGVEDGFSFEKLDAIDLTGQNALVTGGNSGVGFATAKYLIKLGAEVTILCRSQTRCDDAAASIGGDNIKTLIADVSDLKKTRKATNEYAKTIKKLDMLFLNAGIAGSDEVLSVDGIEKIFATNYVGHHLMWQILKPAVLKSKQARVVLTSSGSNFQSYEYGVATDLETLNSAPKGMLTYGQSKLAQVLWAQELTRQLGATSNVYVNSFHPGVVATEIWGKNPSLRDSIFLPVVNFFKKNVMWTELQGAMTMLYLGAAADDLKEKNVRGKYFHPHAQEIVPNVLAQDLELQQKVWSFADALVKLG